MFLNLAYLKRHYVVFEKKFKLRILMISILMLIPTHKYDFFFHKWIKKLFSEENKVPRTLFEARKVAGSAKYKQSKWNCVVLFGQFIYSVY